MVKDWAVDILWDNGNVTISETNEWGEREVTVHSFPAMWDSGKRSHRVYQCGSLIMKDTYDSDHKLWGRAVWDPEFEHWHYMSV